MTRAEIMASIIADDVKAAYEADEENKRDKMKQALETVKLCLKPDGDPDPDIIKELISFGITGVWKKTDSKNAVEIKFGLSYKNMGFEVG